MNSKNYNSSFDQKALNWDTNPEVMNRAMLLYDYFSATLPLNENWEVLEIGCGTGVLGLLMQHKIKNLMLTDTSIGMVEKVLGKLSPLGIQNIQVRVAGIEEIFSWGKQYHWVYSVLAFHHIHDLDSAWNLLANCVVPGGYICIVDLDEEEGGFHGEGFDGHLGFSREVFKSKAIASGFDIVAMDTVFSIRRIQPDNLFMEYPVFCLVAQRR